MFRASFQMLSCRSLKKRKYSQTTPKRNKTKNRSKKPNNQPKTPSHSQHQNQQDDHDHDHDHDHEEELQQEEEEEEGTLGFNLKPSSRPQTHFVQPLGNLLLTADPPSSSTAFNCRNPGLGSLSVLSDDLILDILALLSPSDLSTLSTLSKSLFIFSSHDPLWRNIVLRRFGGSFSFTSSWRSTYFNTLNNPNYPNPDANPNSLHRLRIPNFYSDYLFQSWLCANLEMKPEWLTRDTIARRTRISIEEFIAQFEEPNKPVLLQGCIDHWPALQKWDRDYLAGVSRGASFAVGPVEMKLPDFFAYADSAKEERPLYLFDPKFGDKVPKLVSDYDVPEYFRDDLFAVLGPERPDYRWVIMGPAGSGSSFHVDPNSTSAWNAVIKGSKKWVMFPPEVVPPGVHPSADGAEVACPVSIMEWFMNFYGATKTLKRRPVECVCKAGEVVFVPHGWWHLVINLEDSVAITQNYVSRRNLLDVLDFLKRPNASELVSGTRDRVNLHDKFRTAIETSFPGMTDELTKKAEVKAQQKKLTFWESVSDARNGGFKFNF